MPGKIIGLIERAKNAWLRWYRVRVFEWYTGQKTSGLCILGHVTLLNRNIHIGKNVTIYPNVTLWGDGVIDIADNVDIGINTILYARKEGGGIKIGSCTSIAGNCYIIDSNHGIEKGILIQKQLMSSLPVIIGEDVWIGASCQCIKGCSIDSGAVIGAGSLVNKHIPAQSVAFGIPAAVHKLRP